MRIDDRSLPAQDLPEYVLPLPLHRSRALLVVVAAVAGIACSDLSNDEPRAVEVEVRHVPAEEAREIIERLRSDRDPIRRAAGFAALAGRMSPDAVEVVDEVLRSRHGIPSPVDSLLLLEFWAIHEPERAMRWALAATPTAYRNAAAGIAALAWARQDPVALLKAHGTRHPEVTRALVSGWFESGRPGLEEFVVGLGAGMEGQRALSIYLREALRRDGAQAVMEWAESRRGAELWQGALYRQLASELAMADLPAALRWCEAHCQGPHGANIRHLIASRWADKDGRAAMMWVVSAAPEAPEEIRQAAQAAYRSWLQQDRNAALDWARTIPQPQRSDPWLQPVVALFVASVSWRDPQEALEWVGLIADEDDRERALISIGRRWRDIDEDAAEAWLAQSPLSDEARAKARTYPKGYQGRKQAPPG
jgi:hypothetical protein